MRNNKDLYLLDFCEGSSPEIKSEDMIPWCNFTYCQQIKEYQKPDSNQEMLSKVVYSGSQCLKFFVKNSLQCVASLSSSTY